MPEIIRKSVKNLTCLFVICLTNCIFIIAQDLEVKIKISSSARVKVEGKFLAESSGLATKDISFLRNIADVSNLGERIENFRVFGTNTMPIEVKKLIAGEYQTAEVPYFWQYEVKIGIPERLTDSAHISWVSTDLGLLMLGDLLPKFSHPVAAKITFELPDDWKILSNEERISDKTFDVKNTENAVFLVGNNIRETTVRIDKSTISFASSGEWKFSDDEALEMARSILTEHKTLFKGIPAEKINIILLPFPQDNSNSDRWRAETRGQTITIISGSLPFKSQAIQRLHEQLRHEIFHLWIPNSLALSGNYDWFYEGFTIYHALRTGIELNQIRFEDFLKTLSQAYQMEQFLSDGKSPSLVEASQKRWSSSSNFIYAKGLAVAFLCDIALIKASKGKRSLKDIFNKIYQKHRFPNQVQDGNTAILDILKSFPELRLISQNFIEGNSKIEWNDYLTSIGVELNGTQLKVMPNPNGRQKDLLDKLGYNQWRKLGQKKK